ncbi:MAG: FAD-dependent oxidoreductase [Pseudomonadota bacterium]
MNLPVVVIGAGIIGICCALKLRQAGFDVVVIDHNAPASQTSKGNAAAFAYPEIMPIGSPGAWKRVPRWLLDPLGPLSIDVRVLPEMLPWLVRFVRASSASEVRRISTAQARLMELSESSNQKLVLDLNLSDQVTHQGALTVYRSPQALQSATLEWEIREEAGVEMTLLTAREIADMEPDLQNVSDAIFMPQWTNTLEPFRYAVSIFDFAVGIGVRYIQSKVIDIVSSPNGDNFAKDSSGNHHAFSACVVAAGAWSAELARRVGDRALLASERGYNTTIANPGVQLSHQITFAEEKFVATPLSTGLRIGGAAEFAGMERAPNYTRSDRLVDVAKTYLPGLQNDGGERWMGHRPSTPDSLPVIGRSLGSNTVLYAFGHGHLGLTQSAATGDLITGLIQGRPAPFDLSPFSIERFN